MIVIDFAGTLVKREIIEEANKFRSKILRRGLPGLDEHNDPKRLYKINNEYVEKLTGITKEMKILYRQNDLSLIEMNGDQIQSQISTNLFQIGMYMAANKHGIKIFYDGLVDELKRLKSMGYRLAIVSGVRTDIISGMLAISGIDLEFDLILGQPPKLGLSNEYNFKGLDIEYIIGDKESDFTDGAKSIHVSWGHGEYDADYNIDRPEELREIIKN